MSNNTGILYLLTANHFPSEVFGRFEGTKFFISSINPTAIADDYFTAFFPFLCHDFCGQFMWDKKTLCVNKLLSFHR